MHRGDKKVIGIAGNIGSGKTTAARIFEGYGARYVSADRIGREVLRKITPQLRKKFGTRIMDDGIVDRKKLQEIVFSNPANLKGLNTLSHPILVKRILRYIDRVRSGMIVIDAALLFDWPELYRKVDCSILVTAGKGIKMKRALAKGMERKNFLRILRAQKTETTMAKKAKYVIRNIGTLPALRQKCRKIFEELRNDC
jgi:dephospho-CoA kinase